MLKCLLQKSKLSNWCLIDWLVFYGTSTQIGKFVPTYQGDCKRLRISTIEPDLQTVSIPGLAFSNPEILGLKNGPGLQPQHTSSLWLYVRKVPLAQPSDERTAACQRDFIGASEKGDGGAAHKYTQVMLERFFFHDNVNDTITKIVVMLLWLKHTNVYAFVNMTFYTHHMNSLMDRK